MPVFKQNPPPRGSVRVKNAVLVTVFKFSLRRVISGGDISRAYLILMEPLQLVLYSFLNPTLQCVNRDSHAIKS